MTDETTPPGDPEDDDLGGELPPPVFPPIDEPAAPPPPTAPVPTSAGPAGMYPEPSQATLALVLGILSIVVCQVLGPFAWWLGNKEVEAIDAGRRPPENRSNAVAGRITGIIGTVLLGLGVLVGLAFLVFGIFLAAASTT